MRALQKQITLTRVRSPKMGNCCRWKLAVPGHGRLALLGMSSFSRQRQIVGKLVESKTSFDIGFKP